MERRDFEAIGAVLAPRAMSDEELSLLRELADRRLGSSIGVRLQGDKTLDRLLTCGGVLDSIAKSVLGDAARAVRAILFDKTDKANWTLGWHQDRTIAVRERRQAPGFGPWSRKAGAAHVEPPFELLSRMITLRAHLDPCTADNAPLLIAKGSHRLGRIPSEKTAEIAQKIGAFTCLAESGDVWIYATTILHASEANRRPGHRRVLQIDYASFDLPHGLEWLGVT